MNIISKFHPNPPKMEILTSSTTLPTFPKPSFLSSSKSSLFFSQSSTNALIRSMGLGLRVKTRPNNSPRKGFCCNSLFGLGVPELAVIAGVAFLAFGPKKFPEVGRSFGKTVKSFQQAAKEFKQELKNPEDAESSDNMNEAKTTSENSEEEEIVVSSSKDK